MDSITYNKLEYITSGSGLTPTELNEIVDLMDEYARTHVTEALRKHVVMRGGDSENQFVQHVNKYFKVAYLDKTPNTPTEPLGNGGSAKTVCGGHDPEVVKRMWQDESKYGNRAFE